MTKGGQASQGVALIVNASSDDVNLPKYDSTIGNATGQSKRKRKPWRNKTMDRGFQAYIGLDWADEGHQGSLQEAGSERIEHFELKQTPQAIQEWVGQLRKRFGNGKLAVALEQKRGALIYSLMKYEIFVIFPLNTTAVKSYRKALRASGAKDDVSDSEIQLDFLQKHMERLRRWNAEPVVTRQLRFLVESRRKLVDQATAVSNRVTALLKEYYPAALQMVAEVKSRLGCAFLKRWPSLPALKRAKPEQLKKFYHKHNCRGSRIIRDRITVAAAAQPLIQEQQMIRTYRLLLLAEVAQLKALMAAVEQLDQEIEKVFNHHPDAEIYRSFPAAGAALAPRLAAAMGEDRSKFDSATGLLNLTGVAPVTIHSGKSRIVAFRLGAPKFQRQTFIEFARISTHLSTWAQTDYLAYRARGNSHQAAIRRIAYKWIRILYRCWKDRIPYDEARYMVARANRHGNTSASQNQITKKQKEYS
jgi:transposase